MGSGAYERVKRFLQQLEVSNFSGMRAACTATATVWHNDGKGEQTMDEKLAELASMSSSVDSVRFEIIRRFGNSDEVLQQQTLRLVRDDGVCGEFHSMVYFRFSGDLIERIEEYGYEMPEPLSDGSRS